MKFKNLSIFLEKLEKTSSRNEITKILAELFKKSDSKEIDRIVYLVLGQLAPSYEGKVLNIAEKMIIRAISQAFDKNQEEVKKLYKEKGDLGYVAEEIAKTKKSEGKNLTVNQVFEALLCIAEDSGEKSQERRVKKMAEIFKGLDPLSTRFIARIPLGRLRLGFSEKTILDSLSWMLKGDKSLKGIIKKAYEVLPDPGFLAKKIKEKGLSALKGNVSPKIGIPVAPVLAQRLKSPEEMIEKMGKVSVEPKLDGLRIQIHFKKGKTPFLKAFTRNFKEISAMLPELKDIGKEVSIDSEVILDSEAVGLDEETEKLADFQTTMKRRRKHEIEEAALKTKIQLFVFDILFKDGENLMDKPYSQRRKVLEKVLSGKQRFVLVDALVTDSPSQLESLFREKVSKGFEGIMVKKIDSLYVPGRTGWRWVKMKSEEACEGKLTDTLDCIIMGYTQGKGRRTKFGIGEFLVGVLDREKIKTVSKVGTGLTDEQFRELQKRLAKIVVKEKPKNYVVNKNLEPDFWVIPKEVVEIAADEITVSPIHSAGLGLRFPRLIRFRDEKGIGQATTIDELKELFVLKS